MKIGKLKEGTKVGILLKVGDVPWRLPKNIDFHCRGIIMDKLNGKYKVWISQRLVLIVEKSQIRPLPFDDPVAQLCLLNRWEVYIQKIGIFR